MPSFLAQLKEIDASSLPPAQPQLEPRRVRRQKAREAVKNNKSAQEKAG
jgi:hypothetical protein